MVLGLTAWPWPYPRSYAQAPSHMPKLTVAMNRADPFFERDATGWQFVDIHNGNVDVNYTLYDNTDRVVAFNETTARPEELAYQEPNKRIPAQAHY